MWGALELSSRPLRRLVIDEGAAIQPLVERAASTIADLTWPRASWRRSAHGPRASRRRGAE
jgi:hypothetical protein